VVPDGGGSKFPPKDAWNMGDRYLKLLQSQGTLSQQHPVARQYQVSESHIAMEARLSNDTYTSSTNVGFSIATFDYQRVKHQNLIDEHAMI